MGKEEEMVSPGAIPAGTPKSAPTHTPGPWSRNIPPATKYVTVWSGRNTHVAYVTPKGLTADEVEANINLIAAAPEMLEALQAVDAAAKSGADTISFLLNLNRVAKIAARAIAKATGGDQQ